MRCTSPTRPKALCVRLISALSNDSKAAPGPVLAMNMACAREMACSNRCCRASMASAAPRARSLAVRSSTASICAGSASR